MTARGDTVHGRIAHLELTRTQAIGIALVVLLAGAIMFAQSPMLHDGMHNFRHAAGITCH